MDKKALRTKWNKNVEIVQSSFEKNNLKVISYGFGKIQDNGYMKLMLEIASLKELDEDAVIYVNVNFYDEDGAIVYSDEDEIDGCDFDGYETLKIDFSEEDLAFDAVSCKVYATKE